MEVSELLNQMGGLGAMARELGVDEGAARSGAEALLPAILGGFREQSQAQPSGPGGLPDMLGQLGGGNLLDEVLASQPTNLERGNQVLGQIFGSKDVSRAVARNAAGQTGLDPSTLKQMLPMLGMLVAGYMSKEGSATAPAGTFAGAPDQSSDQRVPVPARGAGGRARRPHAGDAGRPDRRSGVTRGTPIPETVTIVLAWRSKRSVLPRFRHPASPVPPRSSNASLPAAAETSERNPGASVMDCAHGRWRPISSRVPRRPRVPGPPRRSSQ